MKYPQIAKKIVETAVRLWFQQGLYPVQWNVENQIKGAHAECAAFIVRYGNETGVRKWYESAKEKREQLGNDAKMHDGFDLIGMDGSFLDVKWVPDYDEIWVTESTHKMSDYSALIGVKFDSSLEKFDLYMIEKNRFDEVCRNPKKNKLCVALKECKRVWVL